MRRIRLSWTRDRIPGVGRDDDSLVQGRDAPAVLAEQRRAVRRAGARSLGEKGDDADYRALGVPVFDRDAGRAELGGYVARGRR